jgi:WD40 repeat protein
MFAKSLKMIAALALLAGAAAALAVNLLAVGRAQPPGEKSVGKDTQVSGGVAKIGIVSADGIVSHVAWTQDGKLLATASSTYAMDGGDSDAMFPNTTVRIWDAQTGEAKIKLLLAYKEYVNALAFSPSGKFLAIGVQHPHFIDPLMMELDRVRLLEIEKREVTQTIPFAGALGGLAFAPDGKRLAIGGQILADGADPGKMLINLWDMAAGKVGSKIDQPFDANTSGQVTCLAFSPDGTLLAAPQTNANADGTQEFTLPVWDVAAGKVRRKLEGHTGQISSVSFSPDGKTLVSASLDPNDRARVRDLGTGKERTVLDEKLGPIHCAAFSPDGKVIATGGTAEEQDKQGVPFGKVALWDVATGKLLQVLPGEIPPVLAVAFSPDGKTLAFGTGRVLADGKATGDVRLWEVKKAAPPGDK